MRLISLRLQNFRQHVDTTLVFDRGLTGIIGPNGAGKSTLLEAIAWALYGNPAARGTRDSIRFTRAEARAVVRVDLEFELAGHKYHVRRGLSSAECFLDGGETPIANSITSVTELVQRRLGMTRVEFFHTYFTAQKELDVMAALGPAERARFLSRVLGYDRLTGAQELVRERRKALIAETNGLKHAMPERDAVVRAVAEAQAKLASARARARETTASRAAANAHLADITPRWTAAQQERERVQLVLAELRVAELEALNHARDAERLEREILSIDAAHRELAPLTLSLAPLVAMRDELAAMEALAAAEAERHALMERERGLTDEDTKLAERIAQLETAPTFEADTQQQLVALRATLDTTEQALDAERTALARDRQEAETRLDALRAQYTELEQQRETLAGLGEDSPCPTCGRPLGAAYRGVLDLLTEQVETVRIDGNYYRQRVEQLGKPSERVDVLEEQRRAAQHDVAASERRLMKIQTAIAQFATTAEQRTQVSTRLVQVRADLAALPIGYDAQRHTLLRAEVARLSNVQSRAARLSGLLEREPETRSERERVDLLRAATTALVTQLQAQRAALGMNDDAFTNMRDAHERATVDARRTELEALTAAGEADHARSELGAAELARTELARLQARVDALELGKRVHDELDRGFTELRADLNLQLRPELAEIASRFLDVLTDGRYAALEFDEDYNVLVLEDGVPKPVISGGEEDLCNLVLRLAISQMIADRAGQAFSLLILDEVFGSLDDTRRDNVLDLLRRLNHRFEQVIVITHIEQVREGLDRVLLVRFDESRGVSNVTLAQGMDMDEQLAEVA